MTDGPPAPVDHPHADQRRKFMVGYFVLVEVDSFEGEAGLVGERACGWPGDWTHAEPVPVEGQINGYRATARIVRSTALMSTPVDE